MVQEVQDFKTYLHIYVPNNVELVDHKYVCGDEIS